MKEKRSKKESNKEEAKKEGHTGLDFVSLHQQKNNQGTSLPMSPGLL